MTMREVIATMTVLEEVDMVDIVLIEGRLALHSAGVQVPTMVDHAAQFMTDMMALLMTGAKVLVMVGTSVLNMADSAGLYFYFLYFSSLFPQWSSRLFWVTLGLLRAPLCIFIYWCLVLGPFSLQPLTCSEVILKSCSLMEEAGVTCLNGRSMW